MSLSTVGKKADPRFASKFSRETNVERWYDLVENFFSTSNY